MTSRFVEIEISDADAWHKLNDIVNDNFDCSIINEFDKNRNQDIVRVHIFGVKNKK